MPWETEQIENLLAYSAEQGGHPTEHVFTNHGSTYFYIYSDLVDSVKIAIGSVHFERAIRDWWAQGRARMRVTVSMKDARDRDGREIRCWTETGHGNLTALTLVLARPLVVTGREGHQDWYAEEILPHNNEDVPLPYNLGYALPVAS